MKKLIKTIKDIYSIEDLRTRILITILFERKKENENKSK